VELSTGEEKGWIALTCKPYIGEISGQEVRCDIVKCALALYFCIYFYTNISSFLKSDIIVRTFGHILNGLSEPIKRPFRA